MSKSDIRLRMIQKRIRLTASGDIIEPDFNNPRSILIEIIKENGYEVIPLGKDGWVLKVKKGDKYTIVLLNNFGEKDTLDNLCARIMDDNEFDWVTLNSYDPSTFDTLLDQLSKALLK